MGAMTGIRGSTDRNAAACDRRPSTARHRHLSRSLASGPAYSSQGPTKGVRGILIEVERQRNGADERLFEQPWLGRDIPGDEDVLAQPLLTVVSPRRRT